MSTFRRGRTYWIDVTINGTRYRESLDTSDWRKAREKEKDRCEELKKRAPDTQKRRKSYGAMTISEAVESYLRERRGQITARTAAYLSEQARPLIAHFGDLKLRQLTLTSINEYQAIRFDAGRAPKTINGEVSVVRQLLKHSKLWFRFQEDYKPVVNSRPPVGRAASETELRILVETARSRSDWVYAYTATILGAYCGLRACEIKSLRWKDIDFVGGVIEIRRSKTPAGWRSPSMNEACRVALSDLFRKARTLSAAEPEHYVFPWHGREQKIDPTRPLTSWRTAWRSITKAAGVRLRFHDLRHGVVTALAERGLSDWVIMAQVGHVSPQMLKHYSHVRRQALDLAAAALEPSLPKAASPETQMVN